MTEQTSNQSINFPSEQDSSPRQYQSGLPNYSAHEEGDDSEPWLLSYADMVTLLMCFFILFFTLDKSKGGISDPERIKKKLEDLIGLDARLMQDQTECDATVSSSSSPQAVTQPTNRTAKQVKASIESDIKKFAKELKVVFSLATPNASSLELTFLTGNFFESGGDQITTDGIAMLNKVVEKLKSLSPKTVIEIEGHTDSDIVRSGKFRSNWDLSAARSASVAQYLQANGVDPKKLKISGFGPYRPLMPENKARGPENILAKKLNRRVVIRLLLQGRTSDDPSQTKL